GGTVRFVKPWRNMASAPSASGAFALRRWFDMPETQRRQTRRSALQNPIRNAMAGFWRALAEVFPPQSAFRAGEPDGAGWIARPGSVRFVQGVVRAIADKSCFGSQGAQARRFAFRCQTKPGHFAE